MCCIVLFYATNVITTDWIRFLLLKWSFLEILFEMLFLFRSNMYILYMMSKTYVAYFKQRLFLWQTKRKEESLKVSNHVIRHLWSIAHSRVHDASDVLSHFSNECIYEIEIWANDKH